MQRELGARLMQVELLRSETQRPPAALPKVTGSIPRTRL
jgi:hypothetical protein